MANSKHTKRALITSIISLFLCLFMLVGNTFAWLTDNATTGVNKITAGNLKVGLKYSKDFETWQDATAQTEIFDSTALYEPGYTEVVYFEVENEGSLAFNYRVGTNLVRNTLGVNQQGEQIDLTNYIKFGIANVTDKFTTREQALQAVTPMSFANVFVAENSLDTKGEKQIFAMVVFMPSTVGNEVNHNGIDIPSIEFGVQVIATQKSAQSDSFDNLYDTNSTYPNFYFVTYEPDSEIVINGKDFEAVIPVNAGLTTTDNGQALESSTELVMKIDKTENNSNITLQAGDIAIPYVITLQTSDGKAVSSTDKQITVSLDIGKGRTGQIQLYHNDVLVENTTYDAETGILTFATNDFSPFTVIEKGVITADTSWYNETDTEFTLYTADELLGLSQLVDNGNSLANKTIKLGADIDLQNAEWESIGAMGKPLSASFDGQGHTVSNLKITKDTWTQSTGGGGTASDNRQAFISTFTPVGECYIKDLTIENANIIGCRAVAVLLAMLDSANYTTNTLTITNINIIGDVNIDCQYQAGAIIAGSNALKEISNITIDVSENSLISNLRKGIEGTAMNMGSVGGWTYFAKADNIVSNLNVSGKDGCIGGVFGQVLSASGSVASLSNVSYSGKVTVVDYDCQYKIQGVVVSLTQYFNGLIIGTPRFSVVADQATISSTGSLELKMLDGTVYTSNCMGEWYEEWAVDLFGASYDNNTSGYAKKSFSKNYVQPDA